MHLALAVVVVDDKITVIRPDMCWIGLRKNYGKLKSGIQSEAEILKEVIQITECWNTVLGCRSSFAGKYVEGSKSFRPDIQKPRQMENAVRDI